MPVSKMGPRNWAFMLSEANGTRSRSQVVIASGQGGMQAGTVLGRVSATGEWVASPEAETAGIEGAEVARAILGASVDATDEAAHAVVADRDAEVIAEVLIFHASVDDDTKAAAKHVQLDAVGIRAL